MAVKPIRVSQLNGYIKRVLQTDPLLGNVSVIGEISNLKFHGSGHVYFSLKDDSSKINCFLAAGNLENIRYELSEGMEITAFGYIYLYEKGGSYSLNIRDIEIAGVGDLAIAFEKLKEKLSAMGIFAEAHKKELPAFPGKVALVTSETGAAVRDMMKIIGDRNQLTDILVYPVSVQGPKAAKEIASAIDDINLNFKDVDVIIAGRGGGSMEELWAFNEEIVAMSIYRSEIPVISAVGHETDFTIADFAADKRAETPTAAAQMAVPDSRQIEDRLDSLRGELKNSLENIFRCKEIVLSKHSVQSAGRILYQRIELAQLKAAAFQQENIKNITALTEKYEKKLELYGSALDSLNPMSIMKRGYAAVLDEKRNLISSTKNLEVDHSLTLMFTDGDADCKVTEVRRGNNDGKKEKI